MGNQSKLFLTKKQCDHENHNHIQRSTYEGHQYIYWLKSSSFETQVARNNIFRCSIGCEIMLMIKARIRLIFARNIGFHKGFSLGRAQ